MKRMQILVLGATGMLGHKMFQTLSERFDDVYAAVHCPLAELKHIELFASDNVITGFDARQTSQIQEVLTRHKPEIIVNCIGVIKQRAESDSYISSLTLNSLLPHYLAGFAAQWDGRLIHFSTDCVFSGKRGNYTETDQSDAEDLYGRSKFLGEVTTPNALTIRTSMIGRELNHFKSLLEWFMRQKDVRVEGYKHALYSGLTTNILSRIVGDIIRDYPKLSGLYQVTGQTISKFDLLTLIQKQFKLPVEVIPDEMEHCDRSMRGEKFHQATGFVAPSWQELITELAEDPTPYKQWTKGAT